MGKRITLYMTVAILAGFAILMVLNVAALMGYIPPKYISLNDIRGMAVEHNKTLYTLNFEQQNTLADIFNRAMPITKKSFQARKSTLSNPPDVQKIIIYRFNAPDIEITPIGYISKSSSVTDSDHNHGNMVYSAPLWNTDGYLEEAASDELHEILLKTYDS